MPFTMPKQKRPLGGSGGSGGVSGTSGAAPGAAPQQAVPGYVNFSRLLAVNQGGAQKMADNLAGQVEQKGSEASSQIQGAREGFQNKVQSGTLNYQAPTFTRTAGTDASADLYRTAGAMQAQAARGYEGPKDWDEAGYNTTAMAGMAKDAQQAAQNLTTAGGRGAMMREQAQGPYSAGMSSLDAALSGAALGSRGADLASLYGNLSQQLLDYRKEGGEAVESATTASNEAARQYGEQAARFQAMGDQSKESEEYARRNQAAHLQRYPWLAPGAPAPRPITVDGRPVDPRLLIPGMYG